MPGNAYTKVAKAALATGTSMLAAMTSPAAAQTVCTNTLGLLNCSPTTTQSAVQLPGQTAPLTIALPDLYAATTTIVADSTDSINLVLDGTANVVTSSGPGLDLTSGADITARITALATSGDGAPGVLLKAVDDVVLVVDNVVSTAGNESDGINVTAGTVDVSVNQVSTLGIESDGVELVSLSGPAVLNANLIETAGSGSTAAILRAAGDIGVNAGVLRTEGGQALGLDLQSDLGACAILGAGSCDVNAVVGNITTNGFGSIGALVVAAGKTDLGIDVLQTGGDEAAGLDLSADPTVCAALGVGGCDTAFTVNNLTTNGARAPGAIVRAAGNIDGSIGILRTQGADAIGLDLASDPAACAILGAGSCGTAFSVGQLTTQGDGAIGALVRAAGPTTINVGLLETLGDRATGLDIAADPTACVLLGIGQCDTAITAERITTAGDLAAGVLVNAPAQVVADLGLVQTGGNNSPGISIITDPTVCAVLGVGACGVVIGDGNGGTPGGGTDVPGGPGGGTPGTPGGTDVDTDGDNSPGIVVVTPGPVDIDAGNVDTDGDNSPGIVVDGGEGGIDVDFDHVDTDGDNSPGIDIVGTGPINVGGGTVETGGANSPGIIIVGDDGPITVDVGGVVTTGPGSNGIDVTAGGCGAVNITARGPVSVASGIGINAASACTVSVTTTPGAPVSGSDAGINVVSGTGATVTIGDRVSSSDGPALNIDGAPAVVTVQPTGTIDGRFDLTDGNDTLINNGTIVATAGSSFGGGTDTLINTGTIRTTTGAVTFAGLETTTNTGLIDMRDGNPNDTLTLPGNYFGSGGAALGVDVAAGTASDRLVIGGAATGSTNLLVSGTNGALVNGAIVVDAGAGTSAGAFTYAGATSGLVDYSLAYLPGSNDFAIYGLPTTTAAGISLIGEGARQIFYRGNDAVGAHLGSGLGWGGEQPQTYRAFWLQGFGMVQDRDARLSAAPFGQARTYNLDTRQDWFGGQMGVDLAGGAGSVFGITGGYVGSKMRMKAAPARFDYEAANVGAYGRADLGGFTVSGLIKYEHYWVNVRDNTIGLNARTKGDGWGGWLEASYRLGNDGFFVEPLASIEYARINLDRFDGLGTGFDLDEADGLRGKAGVRLGATLADGPSRIVGYGKVQAIHEFKGEDRLRLSNSGLSVDFTNPRPDTYGRGTIGLDIAMSSGVRGFIEASADFAGGVSGGGARGGLSIRF